TKGADLDPLLAAVRDRLVGVVLLGMDAEPFTSALARHAPQIPLRRIDPGDTGEDAGRSRLMEEAVQAAHALAEKGDVVLLAPAAPSIDQSRAYAERGDLFAAAVPRLPRERACLRRTPDGSPAAPPVAPPASCAPTRTNPSATSGAGSATGSGTGCAPRRWTSTA